MYLRMGKEGRESKGEKGEKGEKEGEGGKGRKEEGEGRDKGRKKFVGEKEGKGFKGEKEGNSKGRISVMKKFWKWLDVVFKGVKLFCKNLGLLAAELGFKERFFYNFVLFLFVIVII